MGNCLRREGYDTEEEEAEWEDFVAEQCSFGGGRKARREVKIKMTKKELEELVGKVELKELRVEQVLAQFMNQSLERPWRPALQSIPED
ncbi:hypothetical protein PHAVU_008G267000 [Phaseolus vulgaris]|uniref:Uncharacterized protein n=1 Tax=Phaseolus vulgaris TaxID=3885 RepID=V7BCS2_PHAVU|nr:hypothetical protein PHAVU_008G267000g [Phaseolus vulgaris]ESW14271.1 hypothetical protein PHAVU_008G267000g [Phaseolus vulgaris]